MKLGAKSLRALEESEPIPKIKRFPIYLILDNIYDTYNIGGLFRLADALAIEELYICGESEVPPNHRIKKAAIGTDKIVPWEYYASTSDAISNLKSQISNLSVVSIEQSSFAVPYTNFDYAFPLALIVGNETTGVSKEALAASDAVVEIPMYGINKSLNVIVSAAIVGYHIFSAINFANR